MAKSRPNPKLDQRIAYHEAGHAVASYVENIPFLEVSIEPDGEAAGRCVHPPPPKWFRPADRVDYRTRRRIESEVLVLLAGPAAEAMFAGRECRGRAFGDRREAERLAGLAMYSDEELSAYLRWLRLRARYVVGARWHTVECLAHLLLKKRTIRRTEARKVLADALLYC